MNTREPSIGVVLARPERTFYLAAGLRKRRFAVTYYNPESHDGDPYVKVEPRLLPVAARVLRTDHDVYLSSLFFVGPVCLYLNRLLRGRPYVLNVTGLKWQMFHDQARTRSLPFLFERVLYPFLLNRTLAGASRIVCNSRFAERSLAARYPRYRDRLRTVYNGIAFERYGSGQPAAIPGVGDHDRVVVCVTSLDFENKSKGLRLVTGAFAEVHKRLGDVKLVIAAKAGHGRYAEEIAFDLARGSLRDSVVLLCNHPAVSDLLARSEAFVYATPNDSNDSLPRALLEAQAAGLPAVTTDTVGCPEVVRDGVTGFVVRYDAAAIAEKLLTLLENEGLRREFRAAARRWIPSAFSWDQMAEGYAEVFREVARETSARNH